MNVLTKCIQQAFVRRQREIESFAGRADEIQDIQLKKLLRMAERTEWGRMYDFKSIRSYSGFSERLPLQVYDDIRPYVTRMINGERNTLWPSEVKWFAKSSGTTSDKSKFLPMTREIRQAQYKGAIDCVSLYLRNNPKSRFFEGKGLILGGSHSPSPLNHRAHCGDLSAVLIQHLNPVLNLLRVPKKKIVLMDEWERKIDAIVQGCCRMNVNSLSGVPSWMLILIKAMLKKTGKEYLTEVWPNLEVFFHGGINFSPYRDLYKTLIPSDKMHYMETYNASEGFFSIQDDPNDQSMMLMPDYGIFYEFIPLNRLSEDNPSALQLAEVEKDTNYAMVITTVGGLWRYVIGDTVRFTSLNPHKIVITGRTKHFINAFGEELMVDNADNAISLAGRDTGAKVKEYTAAPLFMLDKAQGLHEWLIEFEDLPPSVSEYATLLDKHLQALNSDYEAKRHKNMALLPLKITVAREGVFYDWLKRQGRLGGQHKVPRLSNSRYIIEELLAINNA
ncbi:MAG: GH3 auxin-responsive promoter family protein [Tannerellaceae bacterium]|jgi:hypothetical protein|nr:GH3 auxin-responsive promoter family protein [Tannerellaceae bacterium]